jgi:TolB protein
MTHITLLYPLPTDPDYPDQLRDLLRAAFPTATLDPIFSVPADEAEMRATLERICQADICVSVLAGEDIAAVRDSGSWTYLHLAYAQACEDTELVPIILETADGWVANWADLAGEGNPLAEVEALNWNPHYPPGRLLLRLQEMVRTDDQWTEPERPPDFSRRLAEHQAAHKAGDEDGDARNAPTEEEQARQRNWMGIGGVIISLLATLSIFLFADGGLLDMAGDDEEDAGRELPLSENSDLAAQGEIIFTTHRFELTELALLDVATGEVQRLTQSEDEELMAAYSPDGSRIAYVANHGDDTDIWVMDASGRNRRVLTQNNDNDWTPAWSPDGLQIAYASEIDGNLNIYLMNADGSNVRRLTEDLAHDAVPQWSPDGQQIVFQSQRTGHWQIYRVFFNGAGLVRLTETGTDEYSPQYSPDGRWIVFSSNRDDNREIYRMNPDGGEVQRLTNDPARDVLPRWSPDGGLILFVRQAEEGQPDIFLMRADGDVLANLTAHEAYDYYPAWRP